MRVGLGALITVTAAATCSNHRPAGFLPHVAHSSSSMLSSRGSGKLKPMQGEVPSPPLPVPGPCDGPSHVCGPWCNCARRRNARSLHRLFASSAEPTQEEEEGQADAEASEGAAPSEEEVEEEKELSPEEKQRQELKAEIKELEAKLAKKRNEFTEAQDRLKTVGKEGYMRLAAEVETYKRRRADGLNFVREEAAKEAVKEFLPVLDLLEELEAKYADVSDEALLKYLNGYRNLQSTFKAKVEKMGLVPIVPAVGDKYDSVTMEAELVVGKEDDVIVSVQQKGYQVGRRIVRPAEVTVSVTEVTKKAREAVEKGLEEAEEEEEEEEIATEEDAKVDV